jgi:hypothetical protein
VRAAVKGFGAVAAIAGCFLIACFGLYVLGATRASSWEIPVREVTLTQWQKPGADVLAPLVPLDDTKVVGEITVGPAVERAASGFDWIEPVAVRNSHECALSIVSPDTERAETGVGFSLIDKSEADCASEARFRVRASDPMKRLPLPSGAVSRVSPRPEFRRFSFLRKALRAREISFVVDRPVSITSQDEQCDAQPGTRVELTGSDVVLTSARFERDAADSLPRLVVSLEARAGFDARVGKLCKLDGGVLATLAGAFRVASLFVGLAGGVLVGLQLYQRFRPGARA